MSLNDTLELDTIIEESSRASDLVTITDGTEGQDFNSNGIRTDTYIFDPINSGTYNIDINGQTLTVEVTDTSNGLIEDFNKTRYEDKGKTLSEYYNGDLSKFSRQTNKKQEGSHAVKLSHNNDPFVIYNTDSLNNYPRPGDTFKCWFLTSNTSEKISILFGLQDNNNTYEVMYDGALYIRIRDTDGGSSTNVSANISPNIWYYFKVSWGENGKIDAKIYDSSDSQVGNTVSTTDERYKSGGIGFWANSPSGSGDQNKYWDKWTVI